MQLTLKRRLWLGFGAIVAVVSLGSATSWWKVSTAVEATKQMVHTNVQEHVTALSVRVGITHATSAMHAFYVDHDERFMASAKEVATTVQQQLSALEQISPDTSRRELAAYAKRLVAQYLTALEKLHASELNQGLTMDTGAHGELREAVHSIEKKLYKQGQTDLSVLLLTARQHEKNYMLRQDHKHVVEVSQTIELFKTQMQSSTLPANVQDDIIELWNTYLTAFMHYVEADRAVMIEREELQTLEGSLLETVTTIAEAAEQNTTATETAVLRELSTITALLLGVFAVVTICGIGMALSTIRAITRPLGQTIALVRNIAAGEGDLTQRLPVGSADEMGELARWFNVFVDKLHDILTQVKNAAEHVAAAAQQVAAGSEHLSTRVQEQAAALEEAAASMEEMTTTVKQNADNAQRANHLSVSAREAAEKGGAVVSAAVASMDEITAASKKITEISGVIDEIAFQTNLLALNAAVEAARAGDYGRGFAVVAAEVRNLAQRSASAAKEIKGLMQNAGQKVADGTALVAQSGHTLHELMGGVQHVSAIVGEIAVASHEQARGIDQVNRTVMQMDHVTQDNAVQTEELSSTAQTLAGQAQHLQALVNQFRLRELATSALDGGSETREPVAAPTQELYNPSPDVLPAVPPASHSHGHVISARLGPAPTPGAEFEEF